MNLKVSANLKSLEVIRKFIRKMSGLAKLSRECAYQMELVVYEACLNIIVHGYVEKEGDILIDTVDKSDSVVISIRDKGKSFDWDKVPVPDFKNIANRKCGLGVLIIKKLVNESRYVSKPQYNELRLVKYKK